MASVTLENIGKSYGALNVMRGIDVHVKQGEFVALVGPSGCGKSTLLRMIAGLEDISAGTVRIGERIVNELQPRERDIAMVFQNYALYPHMNVAQNMGFSLRLAKQPKAEIERQVLEAARILDIEPLLKRLPKQLSGGQRQRVAMGRAIVRNPQVFLFDEPLSNLDAKLRVQMRSEIKRLHNRVGATTIYVTHDQIEAMTMADRIVVLRAGNVEQIGAPIELYDDPVNLFVASFIGSPPVNLLPGCFGQSSAAQTFIVDGGGHLDLHIKRVCSPGERVVLAIRPDRITLGAPYPGQCGASGVVSNVEPTGSETIVFISIGNCTISMIERDRNRQPKIGDTVQIAFDPSAMQFFQNDDAGKRLDTRGEMLQK